MAWMWQAVGSSDPAAEQWRRTGASDSAADSFRGFNGSSIGALGRRARRSHGRYAVASAGVEPLFGNLDIKEVVVTGDAMFAQKKIAEHVVRDKQADYLLFVKDNQPTLRQDIEDLGLEVFPPSAHHAG